MRKTKETDGEEIDGRKDGKVEKKVGCVRGKEGGSRERRGGLTEDKRERERERASGRVINGERGQLKEGARDEEEEWWGDRACSLLAQEVFSGRRPIGLAPSPGVTNSPLADESRPLFAVSIGGSDHQKRSRLSSPSIAHTPSIARSAPPLPPAKSGSAHRATSDEESAVGRNFMSSQRFHLKTTVHLNKQQLFPSK